MSAASDQTGAKGPSPNSTLSAEAAEFVPSRLAPSNNDGTLQQAGGGDKSLAEVPRYLTTCYPFVNMTANQGAKGAGESSNTGTGGGRQYGSPAGFNAGNLQHPCPHMGSFPTQVAYPSSPHPWLPSLQPAPTFTPALSMTPLTPGIHIPFDGGTPSLGAGLLPTPKGDGLLPTPPFPPINTPTILAPTMMMSYPSAQLYVSGDRKVLGASATRGRSVVGRGRGTNVTRGTQNEIFSLPSGGRTHTIIMKDNSVQTDFSKDIADLTLQEKPNMLYRRGQRRNKGSQPITSTDSEEVDSDSGYSSPLHRRNLVSNGTHAVGISGLQDDLDRGKSAVSTGERGKGVMQFTKVTPAPNSSPGEEQSVQGLTRMKGAGSMNAVPATNRSSKPAVKPSPSAWGSEGTMSMGAGQKETVRSSPLVSGKDSPGKGLNKESSRTPFSAKEASRLEESKSDVQHLQSGSSSSSVKHVPSPSGSIPIRQPRSPGSTRRDTAPSPAPPDFPILKPAKRNEPPWSLTPNVSKGKKGDSSGFMGMVADSVKSYASIVKSLSSPANVQSSGPSPQPQQAVLPGQDLKAEGPTLPADMGSGKSSTTEGVTPGGGVPHSQGIGGTKAGGGGVSHVKAGGAVTSGVSDISGKGSDPWQPARTAGGQTSSQEGPAMSGGGVGTRKTRPVWVGKEKGTVLKGETVHLEQDKRPGGAGLSPGRPPSTGVWGSGGALQAESGAFRVESRDLSKQFCDTRTDDFSPGRGAASLHTADSAPQTAAHKPDFLSGEGPAGKEGNKTDSTHQPSAVSGDEKTEDEGKKKRRRRRRRRRHGKSRSGEGDGEGQSDGFSGMERTVSSSNISRTSDVTLHFEDENEFPEIGTVSGSEGVYAVTGNTECVSPLREMQTVTSGVDSWAFSDRRPDPVAWISYSDILKKKPSMNDVRSRTQSAPGSCLSGEEGGDENFNSQPGQGSSGQTAVSKRTRKRRKRRELANRAAEAELAEISLEQQMLRELGHKVTGRGSRPNSASREEKSRSRDEKSPARGLITEQAVVKQAKGGGGGDGSSGKRFHQPIALNIADMLDAFEKKKTLDQKSASVLGGTAKKTTLAGREDKKALTSNLLDGSAPIKRGKEREVPKPKKPSPLKKVILKEREEKKRMRLIGECDVYSGVGLPDNPDPETDPEGNNLEDDLLEDGTTGNPVGLGESDLSQDGLSSRSVDTDQGVSPGADLSPISQTSPLSMSPLTPGASPLNSPIAGYLSRDPVVLRIHSRRFREYCTQILDKDIDMCCTALLHELVRFQDRMYHKDPNKAKGKRRVVLGLREVTKHLKLKKIKCVIISPNLEKIQSKGGLDEALNNILTMCQDQNVPFVFALGRRALGRACAKLVPVSVAGIFNYEGCEEKFNQLISLTHKGREAYAEMVHAMEREIAENPPPSMSVGSSVPSLYAHMGHSRTPSGCSAISFTSSVLSEPISENYPHAEPETDSKGYEIVRDQDGKVIPTARAASFTNGSALGSYQPAMDDFDDGNEADTEDFNDYPPRKKGGGRKGEEVRGKSVELMDSGQVNNGVLSGQSAVNNGVLSGTASQADTVNALHRQAAETGDLQKQMTGDLQKQMTGDLQKQVTGDLQKQVIGEDMEDRQVSEDGDSASESDSQHCVNIDHLPPIDSIHSSGYDLSAEILSQHSSRTVDNSEVLSTHSSRTIGDGSLTPNTEQGRDRPHTPDTSGRSTRTSSGGRLMNKDRVQSWVESCLQEERDSAEQDDSASDTEGPVCGTDP